MPLFDIILEMISHSFVVIFVVFQFISQGAVTEACMVYITCIYLRNTHYLYSHHLASCLCIHHFLATYPDYIFKSHYCFLPIGSSCLLSLSLFGTGGHSLVIKPHC